MIEAIGWDLFSGIGGVKCGMELAGIKPVLGVECDPRDRKLSEAFIDIHHLNGWYGTRLQTVQEFRDWGFPGLPKNALIAHISPVCADFSAAKVKNGIRAKKFNENMEMAIASMDAIEHGMPLNFTIEQVRQYATSKEFQYISSRAIELGYEFRSGVYNVGAPFGQSRHRLIAIASRIGSWQLPTHPVASSWFDNIADLIPAFTPIAPTPRQLNAVSKWYQDHQAYALLPTHKQRPLYVERVTSGRQPKVRGCFELVPTLMKSKFRDGSQNGRSQVSCVYIPLSGAGKWLNLTLEAYSRLQGFPDSFRYPNDCNTVGSGFGYCVPPIWYASLLVTMPR